MTFFFRDRVAAAGPDGTNHTCARSLHAMSHSAGRRVSQARLPPQ